MNGLDIWQRGRWWAAPGLWEGLQTRVADLISWPIGDIHFNAARVLQDFHDRERVGDSET